jgi:hypothetical protein
MVSQRTQITGLAFSARADQSVPLTQRHRIVAIVIILPQRRFDHVGDIARTDRTLTAIEPSQLLKDLPRLRHAVGLAFDTHLAMTGQYFDTERVAHLSKVLVSTAENGELFVLTVETDHGFRHA